MPKANDLALAPTRTRLVRDSFLDWFSSSEPVVWLCSACIALVLIAIFGVLGLIAVRGLAYFSAAPVHTFEYTDHDGASQIVFGRVIERLDTVPSAIRTSADAELDTTSEPEQSWLIKTGNKRFNPPDYRWVDSRAITRKDLDDRVVVIERTASGNVYGVIEGIFQSGSQIETNDRWNELQIRLERVQELRNQIQEQVTLEINQVNFELEQLRLEARRRDLNSQLNQSDLANKNQTLTTRYAILQDELERLNADLARDELHIRIADGRILTVPLQDTVRAWMPNVMSLKEHTAHYLDSIWSFLLDDPRESNTEGGVFPALFGTVLMVLLMSVVVTPVGVVAALYLREYAKQGPFVRLIRIAVVNLAGVPSIVYGVFGLGLFVYVVGGTLDSLFFTQSLPAPTFGTPGLLWASLTLAMLTVPVVIVTTEQGLDRIPNSIREGSSALGATKAETLLKIVLPMASPSILTGMILAVARAAGEVAPLVLVGVVKLAPSLPIDGQFPYLHLERKFMHLGFHIYDLAFQSPNVYAAKPLLFATALLLLLMIVLLNLAAIVMRNRLESKYEESSV